MVVLMGYQALEIIQWRTTIFYDNSITTSLALMVYRENCESFMKNWTFVTRLNKWLRSMFAPKNGLRGTGKHCWSLYARKLIWILLYRPLRQFQNGTATYVAASGLERVLGLARPLCPHAANPFRDRTTCEMYVHSRTVRGLQQWVFQSQHKCDYISMFPCYLTLYK